MRRRGRWRSLRLAEVGARKAAHGAGLAGGRSPKESSLLRFWPAATGSASAFTLHKVLRRKRPIPCHAFASANRGSTHTFLLRIALR